MVVAICIVVLSFIVYFKSTLGVILSPFWCGFMLLVTGVLGLLIRPSRLAILVFIHLLFNALSIAGCFLASGMTGLYGSAVHLPRFSEFRSINTTTSCIFAENSPLYTDKVRQDLRSLDSLVYSCVDLEPFWKYLISIMSLCFMGLVLSVITIVTDCTTPCCEDEYRKTWEVHA
ncbi:hypothetical protein EMCRGX_G006505 [Ephydatia muelleri]|eukprot:Em0002g1895a